MKLRIIAFGIARDIFGNSSIEIEWSFNQPTVRDIKKWLIEQYPDFAQLASFSVAVNAQYVEDGAAINESDEIAIIPPVSGG
jgi:molybdopterin synthase sulfur carrier subunit